MRATPEEPSKPLTERQRHAVETPGSAAVIASAGTGKTAVLTRRFLKHLDDGCDVSRVLAFTFTEKAGQEMRGRIIKEARLGQSDVALLRVSTIHGFCNRLLRRHGALVGLDESFDILDDEAYRAWNAVRVRREILRALEEGDPATAFFHRNYGLGALLRVARALEKINLTALPENELRCESGDPDTRAALDRFLAAQRDLEERLLAERVRARTLTYADLESLTLKILNGHPAAAEKIARAYDHILVDEFQDVSPEQFAIIRRLHRPGENTLFCVGDPKQSIYGFRKADASLFFAMRDLVTSRSGGVEVELDRTFRIARPVQQTLNALFPKILNRGDGGLFSPAESDNESPDAGLYATPLPAETLSPDDESRRIAGDAAAVVEKLLSAGVAPERIAVLSPTRKHFPALADLLSGRGVETAREHAPPALDAELTGLLYHFLLYLGGDSSRVTQMSLLASPLVGLSEKALAAVAALNQPDWLDLDAPPGADETDTRAWMRIKRIADAVKHRVQTLFTAELAWEIFAMLELPADAENLRLVDSLCRILESWRKQGHAFAAESARLLKFLDTADSEWKIPDASEHGVRLLTVHGAKGLEFENVILIPGGRRRADAAVFIHVPGRGFAFKDPDAPDHAGLSHAPRESETYLAFKAAEKDLHERETARLLYVAMTRVKNRLAIVPPAPSKVLREALAKSPEPGAAVREYNDWLCWLACQPQIVPLSSLVLPPRDNPHSSAREPATATHPPPDDEASVVAAKPLLTVSEIETFAACPRKFQLRYVKNIFPPRFTRPAEPLSAPRRAGTIDAATRGTLIHEILQFYDPSRDNLDTVIEQALFNQHVADDGKLRRECENLVTSLRDNPRLGGWLFGGASHRELEFTLDVGGFYLAGKIDGVVSVPSAGGSEWVVVDYKTHECASRREMLESAEAFKFQMACYALAVSEMFGQEKVETRIVYAGCADWVPFLFSGKDLSAFRATLRDLHAQTLRNARAREFALTADRGKCPSCPYYRDDFCGVRSAD